MNQLCYNLHMEMHKLTSDQLNLLKALVSMDSRSAANVGVDAGMSRSALVNFITGARPISGSSLNKLLSSLNLTKNWKLDPHMVHIWQVGADVSPLAIAVNQLFKHPNVVYLTKTLTDDENDAYTGFFLIHDHNESFEHGRPTLPFVIVDRDKYRLGKGTKATVNPAEAQPITNNLFANPINSSNLKVVSNRVYPPEQFETVKSLVEKGITFDDVNELIGNVKTSWVTIVKVAIELGLTPDDVMEMLYRYAAAKN